MDLDFNVCTINTNDATVYQFVHDVVGTLLSFVSYKVHTDGFDLCLQFQRFSIRNANDNFAVRGSQAIQQVKTIN